jgi:hypothetical protein
VDWGGKYGLPSDLDIPTAKFRDIRKNYPDELQRKKAMLEWYVDNHPAPSWKHVANALYSNHKEDVLDILRSQYLKGRPVYL